MASSSLPLGDLYSDEWVPPEHATEEEIKELIADRNYEKHGSAFEAEDVHWLNSREAANKAFDRAIAREDMEDLREFRSRAAASGSSRIPPTSQIAFKEKEDSLFVPGASKQMNILSRLGIKRKSPHSAAAAPAKASAPADSSDNADSLGSSSAHVNEPGASTKTVVAAAAPDSGLSALLDYDDSDD